jgi:hypothetical protein
VASANSASIETMAASCRRIVVLGSFGEHAPRFARSRRSPRVPKRTSDFSLDYLQRLPVASQIRAFTNSHAPVPPARALVEADPDP